MTRRQWMWLWIWLLLFLIIFCVWNKLQTVKNAHHETTVPVSTVSQKQNEPSRAISQNSMQKDIMFKLVKKEGIIRLSGVFPSEEAVEKALQSLKAQGHDVQKGAIIIDPHADNPKVLSAMAKFGESLGDFDNGYLEYKEHTVTINGVVESSAQKQKVASLLADIGNSVAVQNDLAVEPPLTTSKPSPEAAKAPEKNTTATAPVPAVQTTKKAASSAMEQKEREAQKVQAQKEAELKAAQKALDSFLRHKRVEFIYAKDALTPKSRKIIDQIVAILKKYPDVRIEIGGHTDSDGDAKRNLKLSQRRANAVKTYLIKKGIAPKRLVAKGYGESKPLVKNDTRAHKQINRRVEFKVIQ